MNRRRSSHSLTLFAALAVLAAIVLPAAFADDAEIFTVGGEVEKPVRAHGPAPAYPPMAKEERVEGRVVARTVISSDGAVESVEIVESLGEEFEAVVRKVLKEWRFEPATRRGEAVSVYYNLTFNFKLNGDKKDADAES